MRLSVDNSGYSKHPVYAAIRVRDCLRERILRVTVARSRIIPHGESGDVSAYPRDRDTSGERRGKFVTARDDLRPFNSRGPFTGNLFFHECTVEHVIIVVNDNET